MGRPRQVLAIGDQVVFDGVLHNVAALAGTSVRLVSASGQPVVVALSHLLSSPGFEVVGKHPAPPSLVGLGLMDAVSEEVMARARAWEAHVIEVETGLAPDAGEGGQPAPAYDPKSHTLAQREQAKAAELTAAGQPTSRATVRRMRRRYHDQGLWGLIDHRQGRQSDPFGRADPRLLAAIVSAMEAEEAESTGTKSRLRRRVRESLDTYYGPGVVPMGSVATFNRLLDALDAGRHTFGDATTRRTQANRPARPFVGATAARPGQLVQIDSTPLDVMAVLDDGVVGRVELTTSIDVATRSICAAVLRPVATKAVDAALLLAKMVVPEPMRPGWPEALAMARSRLPHEALLGLDARLATAAARPVIVPETIACDRGKVFLSDTFLSACQTLGISVQPARAMTPTDKAICERTFSSINTLLCQHLAGYTGRSVARRGAHVADEAVWSLADLGDLLDEWVVAGWQNRPHEGLRHPLSPGMELSPNEMYAALVAVAGYVPVALSGEDYIELLPVAWRAVGDDGIHIDRRSYDSPELGPYRRRRSPVTAKGGRWEVHHDPYDCSAVWLRRPEGGFVTATWAHLGVVGAPFAEFTWRRARRVASERGEDPASEEVLARVLDELLHSARRGPGSADDRGLARALARQASASSVPLRPPLEDGPEEDGRDEEEGQGATIVALRPAEGEGGAVVPFGIFDPDAGGDYG